MTDKEFWAFLENTLTKKRLSQASCVTDDARAKKIGECFAGHTLLPEYQDKIGRDTIKVMGMLLLGQEISLKTKNAIIMILAHHPTKTALNALREYGRHPDKELEGIMRFAIEECEWWNEG